MKKKAQYKQPIGVGESSYAPAYPDHETDNKSARLDELYKENSA
jgi:hypothetical protein